MRDKIFDELPEAVYQAARSEFFHESFGKDMRGLQGKLHRWAILAYGWEPAWHYAAGVAEELMELNLAGSEAERVDAYVDITNFAVQLCTANRLDAETLWDYAVNFKIYSAITIAGKLSQIALKSDLGVRGLDNTPEGRDLMRRSYAKWITHLFAATREALELLEHKPAIITLFNHAEIITQREPKRLPTLNY